MRIVLVVLAFTALPAMAQTTNCYQVGQSITCNTTPPAQFVAPTPSFAPTPDMMGAYIRGQQARTAADAAAQDAYIRGQQASAAADAATQDAQIRDLQAQLLREQIKAAQAQNAAAEDHRQRLQRFRRSLISLSNCLNEHPKEECSKKAENDPDFVASQADAKAGVISDQEMLAIAHDIDAKQ
jgi:hypothetical protein